MWENKDSSVAYTNIMLLHLFCLLAIAILNLSVYSFNYNKLTFDNKLILQYTNVTHKHHSSNKTCTY